MRAACILSASLMLAAAAPLHAINMQFMKEAPMTRLNAEEVKAFRAFVMKTLDETPQGKTAEWSAAKTTFNSKVTPLKSASDSGLKCRQARIESHSADRQASGDYWFCKDAKSEWQFRTPSKNAKIENP